MIEEFIDKVTGYKYCRPWNSMNKGAPNNAVDAVCYDHDVEYGKVPGLWKYTPWHNSIIIDNADNEFIKKIDAMDEKDISFGGKSFRDFFAAKQRKRRGNAIEIAQGDRPMPLGQRLQRVHGPNPFVVQRLERAVVPKHSFSHRGRNYFIGFKSFFKFMRYRKRRFRKKYRRYKKRRLSRYNKARKVLRSRKFRAASSAFRKAFMKGKRRVKKGVKVSRNIKRALKFESYVSAPKKYDGTCTTAFDMNGASGNVNLLATVLGVAASSTGNYNPEFWIQPGWSGGSANTTVPFQGSPLATFNTGAELNSIISAVGYTASSAVNRTFFYNWETDHELVNCSNYPIRMKVYRCVASDQMSNIGSPATDILTANRGSATYPFPFNLMTQYCSNTTLFPNAATVLNFGPCFSNATTDCTVYASEKNFNPQHCTDLKEHWKVKKVADFELGSMKKCILKEKHRPMEYNSRVWPTSAKKYVTWCYLVSFSADTYKTSAGLFRQPWPTVTCNTHIRCNVQQTTLRDYVAKYVVRSSAYVGTLATCQVNQEGEADVIAD